MSKKKNKQKQYDKNKQKDKKNKQMQNNKGKQKDKKKDKSKQKSKFNDLKKISVTKGDKALIIDNPTNYPLIGMGAQGAVFKLSEDKCVKIYPDPLKASMEQEALKAGQQLDFFPRVFETGENYIVMEYFDAPNLKEYLKNSTHMPMTITKKLLQILKELKRAKFTMIDAPLRHIFVLENENLKVIDHVNASKRQHPVPLKLLRDLNIILLKDAFLEQVEELEPDMYKEWDNYYNKYKMDYRDIAVTSGGSGSAVKVDSAISQTLIGKGHQGAVYRIEEDKCVKIYPKADHANKEKQVLLKNQDLSFIPKVYETGDNYVVMEYLLGPDLNSYLKQQSELSEEVTVELLNILKAQKRAKFKTIDAPLRHVFITANGYKMVDHVYAFTRDQYRPLELFDNLHERNFLDAFLEQVKAIDPELHKEWTKEPIPLGEEQKAMQNNNDKKEKKKKGKKKDKKKNNGKEDKKSSKKQGKNDKRHDQQTKKDKDNKKKKEKK